MPGEIFSPNIFSFQPCCSISGSFTKAKEEIDSVGEYFENNGIRVLSPQKGGLFIPQRGSLWSLGSYPLKSERDISEKDAKEIHIKAIRRSDFLYVCAPMGYVGVSVANEIGFCLGKIPIYTNHRIYLNLFDDAISIAWINLIEIKSPEEVSKIWHKI